MEHETPISAAEAAQVFADLAGESPDPNTVIRRMKRGAATPQGRIYLSGIKSGGRWRTTRQAVVDFINEVTSASIAPAEASQHHGRGEATAAAQ